MKGLSRRCLGVAALSCLLIVACDKEEETVVTAPALTVSASSVIAPYSGGNYSFTYSVANPADDGSVACTADAGWITDLDCSTFGQVGFSVDENTGSEARYGTVTLVYTSSLGSLSGTVAVAQNTADAPVLTLGTVSFTLAAEGGSYEFTYSVENAAADGSVACTSDSDWIGGFDTSADGTVGFTVAENGGDLRTGAITLTYTCAKGVAEENVLVAQASYDSPSVTLAQVGVTASVDGGSYSFAYTVENAASDGSVDCTSDSDWITDIDVATEGSVAFTVAANEDGTMRTGVLTLTYSSSAGNSAASVVVTQVDAVTPYITADAVEIDAEAEGGSYSVTYTLANATSDGELDCTSDTDWITDFDTETEGTVAFTVAPTGLEVQRSGAVTITYTNAYGSTSAEVVLTQAAGTAPTLDLFSVDLTLDYTGGSTYVGYSLSSGTADGELTYSSDAEWLSSTLDENGNWIVSCGVNTGTDIRSGSVTLTYTYSGGSISASLPVYQDFHEGSTGDATFDGTLSSLCGVYEASGLAYSNGSMVSQTWTMTIVQYSDEYVLIDGLTPNFAGSYPDTYAYAALGVLSADKLSIPTQLSGAYNSSNGYYYGYTPCTQYDGSLHYSSNFPDLVFTYDLDTDSWESNYGVFLGAFTINEDYSINTFAAYYDVVAPTITIKKVADASAETSAVHSSAVRNAVKALEGSRDVTFSPYGYNLPLYTDFIAR